jgi:hypothetical protein
MGGQSSLLSLRSQAGMLWLSLCTGAATSRRSPGKGGALSSQLQTSYWEAGKLTMAGRLGLGPWQSKGKQGTKTSFPDSFFPGK